MTFTVKQQHKIQSFSIRHIQVQTTQTIQHSPTHQFYYYLHGTLHHCVKERAYERARDLETSSTFIPLVMGYRFETLYPPAEIKSNIHIMFHFIQFLKRCLCKYICSSIHVYQHLHLSWMLLHSSYYIYISIHGFHYSVVASLFVS